MKNTLYIIYFTSACFLLSCEGEISDNPLVGKWDGVVTSVGYSYTQNGDSVLLASSEPNDIKLTLKADGTGTLKADSGFNVYNSEISWHYKNTTNQIYLFWQLNYSIDNGQINSHQTKILNIKVNQRDNQLWQSTSYSLGEISQDTISVGYATWELERD